MRAVVGDAVAIYRATLFTKSARGGTELPWHQDGGSFWGLDRDPELQIWTALDDVPEESGCVEVVDAEPRGGLATPLGGTIPADVVARAGADAQRLALPALAGEVLLIHNYLWHRSGNNANRPPAPRVHRRLHARVDAVHAQTAQGKRRASSFVYSSGPGLE